MTNFRKRTLKMMLETETCKQVTTVERVGTSMFTITEIDGGAPLRVRFGGDTYTLFASQIALALDRLDRREPLGDDVKISGKYTVRACGGMEKGILIDLLDTDTEHRYVAVSKLERDDCAIEDGHQAGDYRITVTASWKRAP